MDDLQPWEIKIDLTLQTTVDAIDEEQDSISVSIPNLFLLLPQILISFKTNLTNSWLPQSTPFHISSWIVVVFDTFKLDLNPIASAACVSGMSRQCG